MQPLPYSRLRIFVILDNHHHHHHHYQNHFHHHHFHCHQIFAGEPSNATITLQPVENSRSTYWGAGTSITTGDSNSKGL